MFRNILKVLIGLMVLVGVVFVSYFALYLLGGAISHFLGILGKKVEYLNLPPKLLLGLLGFLALCFAFLAIALCELIGELMIEFFERR